jgi:hypothetical protein
VKRNTDLAGDLAVRRAILILPCPSDLAFTLCIPMAGVSTGTGFAANVLSNVLSGLWNKVGQVVKMVISMPQAVADMEAQAQRLDNVIHGINQKLGQEQTQGLAG